jgi:hypothetical protein
MESPRPFDRGSNQHPSHIGSTLAKTLAPEEVRAGDYVTLLHEYTEMPSYYWSNDSALMAPDELVRVRCLPSAGGTPLRVRSICLPYLLVRHPNGEERPLDIRRFRLARLTQHYAARAWKAYKKTASASRTGEQGAANAWSGIVSTDEL